MNFGTLPAIYKDKFILFFDFFFMLDDDDDYPHWFDVIFKKVIAD